MKQQITLEFEDELKAAAFLEVLAYIKKDARPWVEILPRLLQNAKFIACKDGEHFFIVYLADSRGGNIRAVDHIDYQGKRMTCSYGTKFALPMTKEQAERIAPIAKTLFGPNMKVHISPL